jgi:hypothetical protein
MPKTLKEYFAAVPEWQDDVKISALFSRFPQQKEDNPETWNAKYSFWKQIISGICKEKLLGDNCFILNPKILASKLQRNGLVPLGIDVVLVSGSNYSLKCRGKEYW